MCAIAKVLADGSLLSVSRSVAHPNAPHDAKKSVRVDLMFEGWMVEPMGAERCRLTHCDVLTLGGGIPAYIVRKAALGRAASVAKLKVRSAPAGSVRFDRLRRGRLTLSSRLLLLLGHHRMPPRLPPLLSPPTTHARVHSSQALIERDPSLWPASPAVAYPDLLPPALRHLLPLAVREKQDATLEATAAKVAATEAVAEAAAAEEREATAAATELAAAGHSRRRSRSGNLLPLPDPARVAAARAERYARDVLSESIGMPLDSDDEFAESAMSPRSGGARNSAELRAETLPAPRTSPAAAQIAARAARPRNWVLPPLDVHSRFRHVETAATAGVEGGDAAVAECWCAGAADGFEVRGKTYLDDRVK